MGKRRLVLNFSFFQLPATEIPQSTAYGECGGAVLQRTLEHTVAHRIQCTESFARRINR